MCTIHLFDGTNNDTKDRHLQQIADDWKNNRDGGSVLILDDHNEVIVRLQTTKLKHLLSCIKSSKGTRYVVHLRASTTSQTGVGGCHMFDSPSGDWVYCHNGIIHSAEASKHRVDSLCLGPELDSESDISEEAIVLPDWSGYSFANVIAYNSVFATLFIHRSHSGQLHTDGKGNWSTCRIDRNYEALAAGWYAIDSTPIVLYPERPIVSYYRYGNDAWRDSIREYLKDVPPEMLLSDSEDTLTSQDGTEYRPCDDCGAYEKESDLMTHGHDILCPHCYAWNTRHTGGKR